MEKDQKQLTFPWYAERPRRKSYELIAKALPNKDLTFKKALKFNLKSKK